ncbi:MAG: type II secretion system protein [Verrucomicrobiota bacterium]|nr:type II secretion system protein [Verrucomicrobiota bacterium]
MNRYRTSGFTLVELMIVVAIIGLLASMAMASLSKARVRSQNTIFINDVRVFSGDFERYALENRTYPPDTTPTVVPAGMDGYLKVKRWQGVTPIGGSWDWDYNQFGVKAGVSVYQPGARTERMQDIDRMIDDGDLDNGSFRQRSSGYISILEF